MDDRITNRNSCKISLKALTIAVVRAREGY